MTPPEYADLDDGFGDWLAGFIDGEGCFQIDKSPRWDFCTCDFAIAVRADDAEVIHEIHRRTGLGTINHRPGYVKGAMPQIVWRVQRKADCAALVLLLERYPLRAKKRRDFAIWAQAVRLRGELGYGRGTRGSDWTPMRELADQLRAVRQYGEEPEPVVLPEPAQLRLVA